jgi:hypothetical protein
MLPYFFRHYERWVERFVIYDNGSADGTLALLRARPDVEVRAFPWTHPDSFVLSQQALQNTCWHESRGAADWVIVTAIDEHIHRSRMLPYLRACRRQGVTCIPALGYEMISDGFPEPGILLADKLTRGAPSDLMNKLRIFDPTAVQDVNLALGGHGAAPEGRIVYPEQDTMLLLHYKYLGLDYLRPRNALLQTGLKETDQANKWGIHYSASDEQLAATLKELERTAVDIAAEGFQPGQSDAPRQRWWRPAPAAPERAGQN